MHVGMHVCILAPMPPGLCTCSQAIADEVQSVMSLRLGWCGIPALLVPTLLEEEVVLVRGLGAGPA